MATLYNPVKIRVVPRSSPLTSVRAITIGTNVPKSPSDPLTSDHPALHVRFRFSLDRNGGGDEYSPEVDPSWGGADRSLAVKLLLSSIYLLQVACSGNRKNLHCQESPNLLAEL